MHLSNTQTQTAARHSNRHHTCLHASPRLALLTRPHPSSILLLPPPSASTSGQQQPDNEPEDAAYEELLARKREERAAAIRSASRRSRYNPLNNRGASVEQQQEQQQPVSKQEEQPPAPSAASSSKPPQPTQPPAKQRTPPLKPSLTARRRAGGAFSNAGRRLSPSLRQRQQALSLAGDDDDESDGDDTDSEDDDIDADTMRGLQAVAAQMLQGGVLTDLEELDVTVDGERRGTAGQTRRGSVQNGAGSSRRSGSKPKATDPLQDPAFLQRMESLMQEADSDSDSDGEEDIIDVDVEGGVSQPRVKRGLLSSMPGGERIDHKELADMEDIDWDALVAYDSLEKGVEDAQQQEQQKQQQLQRRRQQQRKTLSEQAASSPSQLQHPSPPSPSKAASAAPNAAAPPSRGSTDLSSAASAPNASASSSRGTNTAGVSGAQPMEDADFEEVVRFFEVLNREQKLKEAEESGMGGDRSRKSRGSNSESTSRKSKSKSSESSSSDRKTGEGRSEEASVGDDGNAEVDWQGLGRVFLGKDWEQRELAGIAESMAKVEAAAAAQGSGSAGAGSEELWADEVTSVLLALVLLGHKQYLQEPLLPDGLAEEARTAELWGAPYALLVHDSSKAQALEYANQQALQMLGIASFEDIYSHAAPDFVKDDPQQQQEWLWASAEVEDQYKHTAVIPELRCRRVNTEGSSAATEVVAKNVLLFRVDSLEGDPIGTAVLIREWKEV